MEFKRRGDMIGGGLIYGIVDKWHWSKNGGDYDHHRDFFQIHWEVQANDPGNVRLHVEAPARLPKPTKDPKKQRLGDPFLNGIKQKLLAALFDGDFERGLIAAVQQSGYEYKRGLPHKINISSVQKNKCTEPFRVILNAEQAK